MCNPKQLKIAFIHPDLGIGGAERLVLDVAGALKKFNHTAYFVTNHCDRSHAFEELKDGEFEVQVIGDWLPRSILGRFQALCAYIRMVYLILVYIFFIKKKDQPDVYFVDLIPIAVPFLKWANQKVIYYCHHPDLLASTPGGRLKRLYRKPIDWLEERSTSKADVILVNSEYTSNVFKGTFPQIKKPIRILYPTIAYSYLETVADLKPSTLSALLPDLNVDKNCVFFLSVNRFHPAKKLDLAVNAMHHLKLKLSEEEWEKIYFVMAGGYDPLSAVNAAYYKYLTQLVIDKGLSRKVIFLKSPSDAFKAELLSSCVCLVYTPINEHFGIVPLEAMAVEKPVIACNSGGPRETVDHGVSGYLCEPTPESMSEFMYRIIHKDNAEEMGAKGKTRLNELFSYEKFAECIQNVVLDCIEPSK